MVPPRRTTSGNLQYLRTQSTYDVLVLSYISQIHVFMSITDKTGALKVLWVPRYCPFAPKHPASLCNHMYMPLAGPLCKILGSIPSSLRPLGEPIWPLECPRAPAGSRTITQNTLFPVTSLINCQGEYNAKSGWDRSTREKAHHGFTT